ncbi:MAG TPA: hypothetical protein VFH63_11860 [candidate division Zixibacteria bacterium]|nr:hypothetical protein [candidate division Zixibacteria bacterium]
MRGDERGLLELLRRPDLPGAFERWSLELPPRARQATSPGEWAGALVFIQTGMLEVECRARGYETFVAGDLLALGWLPLRQLRNPGDLPVRLIAVRRRGKRPTRPYLRVTRPDGFSDAGWIGG